MTSQQIQGEERDLRSYAFIDIIKLLLALLVILLAAKVYLGRGSTERSPSPSNTGKSEAAAIGTPAAPPERL